MLDLDRTFLNLILGDLNEVLRVNGSAFFLEIVRSKTSQQKLIKLFPDIYGSLDLSQSFIFHVGFFISL